MARKRVIAHFMHEYEAGEVIPQLSQSVVTDGFAIGEIEEAQIPQLEQRGIIFQELEQKSQPSLNAAAAEERVMSMGLSPLLAPESLETLGPLSASNTYYLTLAGPLLSEWRTELENLDVAFRVTLPDYQWVTRIPATRIAEVRNLPFVTNLKMRDWDRNLPTIQETAGFGSPNEVREMVPHDVLLDKDAPLEEFVKWLRERSIAVAAAEENKARIYLLEDDPRLTEISQLTDWVIDIQPYVPPQLHNDHARVLLGASGPPAANPQFRFPFEGDTEIVAVADTGLDNTHPDFPANRVVGIIALGRPNDTSDPHGHGTHVAGSVLGDGSASNGSIQGTAPRARLFFQSLLDKNGGLGGLPFLLGKLFAEAYAAGARIHSNSWGSAAMAAYRVNSREVDEYVYGQKDMLIVISAGNEGTAADPPLGARNSKLGFVDWLSVGAPATAKNALTVGASCSDRTSGGFSTLTYGGLWPPKFPADPAAKERVSGDAQSIAAFSSRGPCDDYRIKPDVVAPGTDILSCQSSQAPLRNFWGPGPNPKYAYMGGTSMATPLVAGCAAVVRQYYTQERNHRPSAALIKATLINSTKSLTGPNATADFAAQPNYHQGFGLVYLPLAVPNDLEPGFGLEFYDNWDSAGQHFTSTGQRRRFSFNLNAGAFLRITMAYTDPPGRALQNNLNLFLQLPDGSKKYGNMSLPQGMNRPDATNNVEVIRLDQPPAGNYLIQVVVSNLLQPQDFALVVTGDFSTSMTEV